MHRFLPFRRPRIARLAWAVALAWAFPGDFAQAAEGPSLSQRLQEAITPYVIQKDATSGWRFTVPPNLVRGNDGAFSIRAEKLAYVIAKPLTIDFPGVEAAVVPEGDGFALTLTLLGEPQLRGANGVVATFTLGQHKLAGHWDPVRESFKTLEAQFIGPRLALANGMSVGIDKLTGNFATKPGETAETTGQLNGVIAAEGIKSRTGDDQAWSTVESAKLGLILKDADKASSLKIDFDHTLPPNRYRGAMAELVPTQFDLTATVTPFPWQAVLRDFPVTVAAVADRTVTAPTQLWRAAWGRLAPILATAGADVTSSRFNGMSTGLKMTGNAEVHFKEGSDPTGKAKLDVKGINDRIAALTPKHRSDDPMRFPTLALLTVVGKTATVDGQRLHRFICDVSGGVVNVNGRDVTTLKPTP